METIETLSQNYEKYLNLLRKFFPENLAAIDAMETEMGNRLFLAPRGLTEKVGGRPGGLVSFAVSVAKNTKVFKTLIDQRKLIRVALIHELGLMGSPTDECFLPETSDWHRHTLGKVFKYNEACQKMSFAHRTLFYVARYGFTVEEDEWMALLTASGFQYDENRFYANEVMPLATALQACRTFAMKELSE